MKWLTASIALHLCAGLLLGFWLCPWAESIRPDVRGVVDVDVLVVADQPSGGEKRSAPPPKPAPAPAAKQVLAAPALNPKPVAQTSAPVADKPVDQVTINEGGPRVLSIAEYLKWVRDHNEAPSYPRIARIRGEQGRVVVRVIVLQRGSPLEASNIEQSSGSELLDKVALEAARNWRFPPFSGTKASIAIVIPFKFSLD